MGISGRSSRCVSNGPQNAKDGSRPLLAFTSRRWNRRAGRDRAARREARDGTIDEQLAFGPAGYANASAHSSGLNPTITRSPRPSSRTSTGRLTSFPSAASQAAISASAAAETLSLPIAR